MTINSISNENEKGNIVGIERDNGAYYLLRAGAPADTRSGHEHRCTHDRERVTVYVYRTALDLAFNGGAHLYRVDYSRWHGRVYFQSRPVSGDELACALTRQVEVLPVGEDV